MDIPRIANDLLTIRQTNPLIHNVTNLVVMPTTANMLLALGASPIMAHAQEELGDIVSLAAALVINIGTLDLAWITSIEKAQQIAIEQNIPIVFDPVGAGASTYRTNTARRIVANGVNIVRGNASEIMALVDDNVKSHGVDSRDASSQAINAARQLATKHQCTVIASGKTDYIVNTTQVISAHNGSPMLTKVTGMGCALTAIMGAFVAVNNNFQQAAVSALTTFNIAAEIAVKKVPNPGSFAVTLLDTLYTLAEPDLKGAKLETEQFSHAN